MAIAGYALALMGKLEEPYLSKFLNTAKGEESPQGEGVCGWGKGSPQGEGPGHTVSQDAWFLA